MGDMASAVKPTRQERADRTRARIVASAYDAFCRSGYHGTTMAAIAADAGVAVQTVYFVFRTKPALLDAVFQAAVLGPEPVPPMETVWWREMTLAAERGDGPAAVATFVDGNGQIVRRVAPLLAVVRAASSTEPDANAVLERHEQLRVLGYQSALDVWTPNVALRLPGEEARDVLLTLAGPTVYGSLREDRGWDHDRITEWTTRVLAELLLAPVERKPVRAKRARP
jgi:AcrR family transcriptional regulator